MNSDTGDLLKTPLYPVRGTVLFLNIIFSLLLFLSIKGGLLGIWLGAFVLFWLFKYAFLLLEHTALGFNTPPELSYEHIRPLEDLRPLKLLLVCGLVYAGYTGLASSGLSIAANILLWCFACLVPAMIALLAIEDNFVSILNPVKLLSFIRTIGPVYIFMLTGVGGGVYAILHFHETSAGLLLSLVGYQYIIYLVFHLLGKIVYIRRGSIGLQVYKSPELEKKAVDDFRDRLYGRFLAEMYQNRRAGKFPVLVQRICDYIEREGGDTFIYDWFYQGLGEWQDKRIRALYATPYIQHLLQEGNSRRAIEVVLNEQSSNEGFILTDPRLDLEMADTVLLAGYPHEACLLLQDFHIHFPDSSLIPDALVKALGILFERYHDRIRCRRLLQVLADRYPDVYTGPNVSRIAGQV